MGAAWPTEACLVLAYLRSIAFFLLRRNSTSNRKVDRPHVTMQVAHPQSQPCLQPSQGALVHLMLEMGH